MKIKRTVIIAVLVFATFLSLAILGLTGIQQTANAQIQNQTKSFVPPTSSAQL